MDYPLIIDGNDAGTLSVSEEGLYTCFEAHAVEHDGLVRLWVCGGGECAYLGVMQPWSGGLYLRRRLSRRELAHLAGEAVAGFQKRLEEGDSFAEKALEEACRDLIYTRL